MPFPFLIMRKTSIILLILFFAKGYSQNLVPNSSFETILYCPNWTSQLQNIGLPWSTIGSADIFNSCDSTNIVGVPYNGFGNEPAHTEIGYAGFNSFAAYFTWGFEYPQVKLTDSLKAGKKYYAEFYVSLADSCYYACNNIGVYFSKDSISVLTTPPLSYVPQIENPHSNALTNKIGWTKVSGYYTANGGEQYIVIGNFHDNANSDTVFVGGFPSTNNWNRSYYYLDDVVVRLDTTQGVEENDLMKQKIKLYPNPADKNILVEMNASLYNNINISIYDYTGAIVQKTIIKNDLTTIDISSLSAGIYLYRITDSNNILQSSKIIIIR